MYSINIDEYRGTQSAKNRPTDINNKNYFGNIKEVICRYL